MNDESRPKAAPETSAQTAIDSVQRGSLATVELGAQLRRRREAAWRSPPLPDGRRDPLGPVTDGRSEW